MIELRRKSDAGSGELDLQLPPAPVVNTNPIETHANAHLQQRIDRLNRALLATHENEILREQNQRLQEENAKLFKQAYFDKLTGLPNQRLLEKSFEEAVDSGESMVLLFIDLNKFKQINDTYGHNVGDDALKLASNTLASLTRATDVVANISEEKEDPKTHLPVRYAGDEFIILFRGTTLNDLKNKIEDVKTTFKTLSLQVGEDTIPVGASIGAYQYQKGDTLEHCKEQADLEMYKDKKASRINTANNPYSRSLTGYFMPASTNSYIPTTTGYSALPNISYPKPEPQ